MAAVRSRVFRGPPRHTDARCVRKPIFADSADSDSDVRDLSPLDSQHDAATPLHHAAEEGDVSLIRALLKIGARVDERDAEGQTPLMAAASWGEPEAIRALVEGGADTSAQDDGGDTALHEAARADEVESLMMLLELGAEKDPRNKLGATPLHLASHKGNNAATKALIRGGAAVRRGEALWFWCPFLLRAEGDGDAAAAVRGRRRRRFRCWRRRGRRGEDRCWWRRHGARRGDRRRRRLAARDPGLVDVLSREKPLQGLARRARRRLAVGRGPPREPNFSGSFVAVLP